MSKKSMPLHIKIRSPNTGIHFPNKVERQLLLYQISFLRGEFNLPLVLGVKPCHLSLSLRLHLQRICTVSFTQPKRPVRACIFIIDTIRLLLPYLHFHFCSYQKNQISLVGFFFVYIEVFKKKYTSQISQGNLLKR